MKARGIFNFRTGKPSAIREAAKIITLLSQHRKDKNERENVTEREKMKEKRIILSPLLSPVDTLPHYCTAVVIPAFPGILPFFSFRVTLLASKP